MSSKADCLWVYPCFGQPKNLIHFEKPSPIRKYQPVIFQFPIQKYEPIIFQFPENELDERRLYKLVKRYVLSKKQLKEYGYPYQSPEDPKKTICNPSIWEKDKCAGERICSRCSVPYLPATEENADSCLESCQYHIYRCKAMFVCGAVKRLYPCCGKEEDTPGCRWFRCHVSNCYNLSNESFVSTEKKDDVKNTNRIYGLDCEMCYTLNGLEVTRVSVVSYNGTVVYETYVLPEAPIIDYNTDFSGITAAHLKDITVKLPDVQEKLLQLFDSDTIVVGHALENDFKALGLVHENVIDTSVLFPHKSGWPYRRSLKSLTQTYLHYSIQESKSGHDSIEDARACMNLLFHRMCGYC